MFDIAWTEMLILVLITLLVVGPKDLPKVVRAVGGMVRKARGLAGEFRQGLDQLAREAELEDIKKQTEDVGNIDVASDFKRKVDPNTGLDLPTGPRADRKATSPQSNEGNEGGQSGDGGTSAQDDAGADESSPDSASGADGPDSKSPARGDDDKGGTA